MSGEGKWPAPGSRLPRGTGIASWVASAGQPAIADRAAPADNFLLEPPPAVGHAGGSVMAAPLIHDGDCLGVIEVLDRGDRPAHDPRNLDLLVLLADQATTTLAAGQLR